MGAFIPRVSGRIINIQGNPWRCFNLLLVPLWIISRNYMTRACCLFNSSISIDNHDSMFASDITLRQKVI